MDYIIQQVSPADERIQKLIAELNTFQIGLYGIEKCTLETPEQMLKNGAYMLGAFQGNEILGMGAVKLLDNYAEIKRMYISQEARGKGMASGILKELESHVRKNGINIIKLETGDQHTEAMALYEKHGFRKCARFGNYPVNDISVYYEKNLS
jgi:putative acetyltransferase